METANNFSGKHKSSLESRGMKPLTTSNLQNSYLNLSPGDELNQINNVSRKISQEETSRSFTGMSDGYASGKKTTRISSP